MRIVYKNTLKTSVFTQKIKITPKINDKRKKNRKTNV